MQGRGQMGQSQTSARPEHQRGQRAEARGQRPRGQRCSRFPLRACFAPCPLPVADWPGQARVFRESTWAIRGRVTWSRPGRTPAKRCSERGLEQRAASRSAAQEPATPRARARCTLIGPALPSPCSRARWARCMVPWATGLCVGAGTVSQSVICGIGRGLTRD